MLEKRAEPPVKLPPKPVEKALPKPDPAVLERRLARQQALAQQRAAEQAELQQQREQAAAQAELQRQRQLQAQAAADARRLAQQRAQQEVFLARAAQQAANATPVMSSPRFGNALGNRITRVLQWKQESRVQRLCE